jgi:hypothetical protein
MAALPPAGSPAPEQPPAAPAAAGGAGDGFAFEGRPLEPLPLVTQQFGANWGAMKQQSKDVVAGSSVNTLDLLKQRIVALGLHCVDAIPKTQEAIASAKLANSDMTTLVHFKLKLSGIDVTVRSSNMGYSQALLGHLKPRLR